MTWSRRWKIVLIGLSVGLLVAVLGSLWLLRSTGGRDWFLARAIAVLPAGSTVTWQSLDGSLSGPLEIRDLHYAYKAHRFDAARVRIDHGLWPLLSGHLDINSLTIALDFLQQQQQHKKRTLVLSDILQSGKSANELYADIAFILQQKNINRFIGIGPDISRQKAAFINIEETVFFTSTAEFKQQFHSLHFHDETILLKGARLFEFELISHLLEQKVHQTVLEINLDAITHNLKAYQHQLQPGIKLMAMVKAFSYGSGSFEIANLLQFHKVDSSAFITIMGNDIPDLRNSTPSSAYATAK